jgi:hypothetical protein
MPKWKVRKSKRVQTLREHIALSSRFQWQKILPEKENKETGNEQKKKSFVLTNFNF